LILGDVQTRPRMSALLSRNMFKNTFAFMAETDESQVK
jgi:hypothetical protein